MERRVQQLTDRYGQYPYEYSYAFTVLESFAEYD